jgi:vanillate O-demethylase monooxygenase subunit
VSALVRDQWYVAAWSHEVGRALLARSILGEPIVMYRTEAGEVAALADRCPHRRFPLSLGVLKGDAVECAYHGFTFDCAGACTWVPGGAKIPPAARVALYPIVERDALIWLWIGDPARADAALVPPAPWLASPGWVSVTGMEFLPARYGLLVDNLLDLSHETYLHAGHIGTPEVAATPISTELDEARRTVRVSRRMTNAECPPYYAKSTGITGRIDRWQDVEYIAPCLYVLHVRIAPTGIHPAPDGSDPHGFHVKIIFGITPETETSTFDFWAVARDFGLADAELSTMFWTMNRTVILQDVEALTKLERVIAAEPADTREVSIAIDAGGLAARRLLKNLRAGKASEKVTG